MPRDLGDGLVLRLATPADAEAVAACHNRNQNAEVADWVRAMMENAYGSPEPDHFLVVESTATGRIVSSIGIVPGRTHYAGLLLRSAKIELASTDADFRRRGLVRAQFAAAHELFRAGGVLLDHVTGKPWVYRQLGQYTLAWPEAAGHLLGLRGLPPAEHGAPRLHLRPAVPGDLAFVGERFRRGSRRYVLHQHLTDRQLAVEAGFPQNAQIIVDGAGTAVGFVVCGPELEDDMLVVKALELDEGCCWLDVKGPLLRHLLARGSALAAEGGEPLGAIALRLGEAHPFYDVVRDAMHRVDPGFCAYLHIGDFCAFVRAVRPVLEARLAHSPAAAYTGRVRIHTWSPTAGFGATFAHGRLEHVAPCVSEDSDAHLPPELLTRLLVGRASLDELAAEHPEVSTPNPEAAVVLRALFPPGPSYAAF
jgi:hypothetical protein